jgi:hypothetical protein
MHGMRRKRFWKNKRWLTPGNGNTLAEYVVIGCGVCLVALAGAHMLGGNLNDILSGLRDDLSQHVAAAAAHSAVVTSGNGGSNQAGSSVAGYPNGSTVCYANNQWCLQASAIQDQAMVQATGANGSQEVLHEQADLIAAIAQQMGSDPNSDPTLRDLITQLANAGHTVADNLDKATDSYQGMGGDYAADYDAFWRSQMPFDDLKKQTLTYLQDHPDTLPQPVQTVLHGAADSINAKLALLISGNGPNYASWQEMVTPIHEDSNTICGQGGSASQCTRNGPP